MKKTKKLLWFIILISHISIYSFGEEKTVYVIKYSGIISPAASEYITKSLEEARENGAYLVIIMLDTPGGLSESMREIIKVILSYPIPLVVYTAPAGARCASAGAFIQISAPISAMASGTSIGAAHPVQLGAKTKDKTMLKKIENDAISYIKALAKKRHKNPKIAELMVKESLSLDSETAKQKGIINIIANDIHSLLHKLNNYEVEINGKKIILNTTNLQIKYITPRFKYKLLSIITNPTVAYLLFLGGLLGLYVEIMHPGLIFPGFFGAISLLLALYSFSILPINYAGIFLILIGIGAFILEFFTTSYGTLTIFGGIAFFLGSIMLLDSKAPFLSIPISVILSVLIGIMIVIFGMLYIAGKTIFQKPLTGQEGLIGKIGEAITEIDKNNGKIFVMGEIWNAKTISQTIKKGEKVVIIAIDGMTVIVERYQEGS